MNIERYINNLHLLEKQNKDFLHLTVNENQLSRLANSFLNTKLDERYFFGRGENNVVDFFSYTFKGLGYIEDIVAIAEKKLKIMAGAEVAILNCFSGLHAMMLTIIESSKVNDCIMSIPFQSGGHSATKHIVESIGRKHVYAEFDNENLDFDCEKTAQIFNKFKCKAIYIDISVHLNSLNISKLRKALGDEALIIYDASHSLGLILGDQMQSPLKVGADILCSNTHKTFPGPQRGIILYKNVELGEQSKLHLNSTLVSSVHVGSLIALCISILEIDRYGKEYAQDVVRNSLSLANALRVLGYDLRNANNRKFSNNEQVHLFIDGIGSRVKLYSNLIENNISTNFMNVLGGRSFARLGTQEVTRRGMKEREMKLIASFLDQALNNKNVKEEVIELSSCFSDVHYSFDSVFYGKR